MEYYELLKGEMLVDTNLQMYVQAVEEIEEGIILVFDGLKEHESDIEDLEKIQLPDALNLFGFELIVNQKRGTEKYKSKRNIIDIKDEEYFIKGIAVKTISDMQIAFQLFKLITFKMKNRK